MANPPLMSKAELDAVKSMASSLEDIARKTVAGEQSWQLPAKEVAWILRIVDDLAERGANVRDIMENVQFVYQQHPVTTAGAGSERIKLLKDAYAAQTTATRAVETPADVDQADAIKLFKARSQSTRATSPTHNTASSTRAPSDRLAALTSPKRAQAQDVHSRASNHDENVLGDAGGDVSDAARTGEGAREAELLRELNARGAVNEADRERLMAARILPGSRSSLADDSEETGLGESESARGGARSPSRRPLSPRAKKAAAVRLAKADKLRETYAEEEEEGDAAAGAGRRAQATQRKGTGSPRAAARRSVSPKRK